MKIKQTKQVGPYKPGDVREVGSITGIYMIERELAEEIKEDPKRGPGRPKKLEISK